MSPDAVVGGTNPAASRHPWWTDERRPWVSGGVAFLLAFFGVIAADLTHHGSLIHQPLTAITGVSQFAVLYVLAQLVERTVEPFSDSEALFGSDQKEAAASDKKAGKKAGKKAAPGTGSTTVSEQNARTIGLWLLASAFGIVLCYFTIGLFQMVGVSFSVWGGHTLDAILSGVIVGGGTKPLHDLIGYIEKSSSSS